MKWREGELTSAKLALRLYSVKDSIDAESLNSKSPNVVCNSLSLAIIDISKAISI